MKNYLLLISSLLLALVISSCSQSVEKQSEKLFKYINKEDTDAIKLITVAAYDDIIVNLAKEFYAEYGEIEEYENYDTDEMNYFVDESEIDGQKKTVVKYKCQTAKNNVEVYIKLDFIHEGGKDDGDLIITEMIYSTDKEFIDVYDENFQLASIVINEYYRCFEESDDVNFIKLFDDSILLNEDNLENYTNILSKRIEKFENIDFSYFISSTSEFIEDKPVVKFIYGCSSDGNVFHEKVSLIKNNNEFKIFDYSFAENLDDLK